jgi:hypothetical protein
LVGLGSNYLTCKGVDSSAASLKTLNFSIEPLQVPGQVSVTFDAVLARPFKNGSQVFIDVMHRIFVWGIPQWVPIDKYNFDACSELGRLCPNQTQYKCPMPVGELNGSVTIDLKDPVPHMPKTWKDGLYWVRVWISNGPRQSNGQFIPYICEEIELTANFI